MLKPRPEVFPVMFPRDITPMSVFEETSWVGIEGQCTECKKIFFIPYPGEYGYCPSCLYEHKTRVMVNPPTWIDDARYEALLYSLHLKACKN